MRNKNFKSFDERQKVRKKNKNYFKSLKKFLQKSVHKFKNILPFPTKVSNEKTKFSFSYITKTTEKLFDPKDIIKEKINFEKLSNKKDNQYLTKTIKLYPTDIQKLYIEKIFIAYIVMYNKTITYINELIKKEKNIPTTINEFKEDLYDEKISISDDYYFTINNKKINIPSHTLDYAINDAKNNYDGNMTKISKGLIKHFRLRKLKFTKPNKIFKLEKEQLQENTFVSSIMGEIMKCSEKNYNYKENCESVSIVTKRGNEYYFLSKQIIEFYETKNNNIGAIDPGLKTVLTIYSNNGIVEIGKGMKEYLVPKIKETYDIMSDRVRLRFKEKYLKKMEELRENGGRSNKFIEDRIKNVDKIIQKKMQKIKNKKLKKIKNQVKDFQWKAANYITDEYKYILFGNMSTKKTGEKKGDKMSKDVGKMLSFYKLKEKIKNRSLHKKVNYKEVNEAFTSCICGNCGHHKKDLGCANEYECKKCKTKFGRDINGARNILIASTRKE